MAANEKVFENNKTISSLGAELAKTMSANQATVIKLADQTDTHTKERRELEEITNTQVSLIDRLQKVGGTFRSAISCLALGVWHLFGCVR